MVERLTRGRAVSEEGPLTIASGFAHCSGRPFVLGSSHALARGRTLAGFSAHTFLSSEGSSHAQLLGQSFGLIAVGLIWTMEPIPMVELDAIVASTASSAIHEHKGGSAESPWSGLGRARGGGGNMQLLGRGVAGAGRGSAGRARLQCLDGCIVEDDGTKASSATVDTALVCWRVEGDDNCFGRIAGRKVHPGHLRRREPFRLWTLVWAGDTPLYAGFTIFAVVWVIGVIVDPVNLADPLRAASGTPLSIRIHLFAFALFASTPCGASGGNLLPRRGVCLVLAAGTIGAFCLVGIVWRVAGPNGAACVTFIRSILPFLLTWAWRRLQISSAVPRGARSVVDSGLEVPPPALVSSGACFLHRVTGGGRVEEIEDIGRCGRPRAQRMERHWLCRLTSQWLLG